MPKFNLVQNDKIISSADTPYALDYTKLEDFVGWSILADYGKHLHCAARVEHFSDLYGDAAYAVNAGWDSNYHVNGHVFVPCAVRDRLMGWFVRGSFDVFKACLPCVMVRPVLTTRGPASPYYSPV